MSTAMSDESRSLPDRPNLRYLKLEARRRLTAGEFEERFLAAAVPWRLVAMLASRAARLRGELVILGQQPPTVRAQVGGIRIEATAAAPASQLADEALREVGLPGLVLAGGAVLRRGRRRNRQHPRHPRPHVSRRSLASWWSADSCSPYQPILSTRGMNRSSTIARIRSGGIAW
jgi:hypothetical protein